MHLVVLSVCLCVLKSDEITFYFHFPLGVRFRLGFCLSASFSVQIIMKCKNCFAGTLPDYFSSYGHVWFFFSLVSFY